MTDPKEIHAAIQESRCLLERLRADPLFTELDSAERHHEVRYDLPNERGIMDLLYRAVDGWFIIDFKTDEVRSESEAQSAISQNGYDRQVERYVQANEAGIACDITPKGRETTPVICSLTQLEVMENDALANEMKAYQQERLKNLARYPGNDRPVSFTVTPRPKK